MQTTDMAQLHRDLADLNSKIQRMVDVIEVVKDKQEEMAEDITKIKEAVYDPDKGIYARLRDLENWKKGTSRVVWILATSMIGLATAAIFSNVFS
tara:strand:+ start:93 stop:377 length:285 start_codon:yes stop_codon:yes gene_type:complete